MIHWEEGQHLLPQHLQKLQKFVLERIGDERPLSHRFTYGIIECELAIEKSVISVRRLRAVMPSGVLIDTEKNTVIPSLDVSDELARRRDGFKLRLGLPRWQERSDNAFDLKSAASRKLLYGWEEVPVRDENNGRGEQMIRIRKFNARLLVESDGSDDFETIELARFEPTGREALPRLVEDFCPAVLRLRAWSPLYSYVRRKVAEIENARNSLLGRLGEGGGFDPGDLTGDQLMLILRLRTANNFGSRLAALVDVDQASPFEVFCDLQSMLGELAALEPLKASFQPAAFLHRAPFDQFRALCDNILLLLDPETSTRYHRFEFGVVDDSGVSQYWMSQLDTGAIDRETEVYFCLESTALRKDVTEIMETDEGPIKLTAYRDMRGALPGLKLSRCEAPKGLSARPIFHYFRVSQDADANSIDLWNMILGDGKVGLSVTRVAINVSSYCLYLS